MDDEKKLIALVDDCNTNLYVGKQMLGEKYNVATAPSAKHLFLFLEKNTPALILLDIEMPEMDGFEAIKLLKAKPETRDIPVIFYTSRNDETSKSTGFALGAVDYISKPYEPSLFLKRIEKHMANNNEETI